MGGLLDFAKWAKRGMGVSADSFRGFMNEWEGESGVVVASLIG